MGVIFAVLVEPLSPQAKGLTTPPSPLPVEFSVE